MRQTISLGRIRGVRVGLHWSVVGIIVLIVVLLGVYQLPAILPGYSTAGYVLAGVASAVLLVLSLLCHEMAHAVVARRNGVTVEGITLWLFGGVARLRGEANSPKAELRITAVGPLASAALAVVFAAATFLLAWLDVTALVVVVLAYLTLLNLALAVFNMIPAAPLDGGRVLRAALWWWRGDRFKAALWSARAGRVFGFLLIIGGFVQVAVRNFGGLWWVLVGWVILGMAAAEEQHARMGVALADVRVRDAMSSPVDTAEATQTVEHFLDQLAMRRPHGAFPLLERGELVGLVTVPGLREVSRDAQPRTTLRAVATPLDSVPAAEPDEPLPLVLSRLSGTTQGRLLVRSEHDLVGIVSPSDISRVFAAHGVRGGSRLPGGAERQQRTQEPPPSGWWYPGQGQGG